MIYIIPGMDILVQILDSIREHYALFSLFAIPLLYFFAKFVLHLIEMPRKPKLKNSITETASVPHYYLDYKTHGFMKNPNDFKEYLIESIKKIMQGKECPLSPVAAIYIGKHYPGNIRVSEDGKYYMLSRSALDTFYQEIARKDLRQIINEINEIEKSLIDQNSEKVILNACDLFYRIRNGLININSDTPVMCFAKAECDIEIKQKNNALPSHDNSSYAEYIKSSFEENIDNKTVEVIESKDIKVIISDENVEVIRKHDKSKKKKKENNNDIAEQVRSLQEKVLEIYEQTNKEHYLTRGDIEEKEEQADTIIEKIVNNSADSHQELSKPRKSDAHNSNEIKEKYENKIDAILFDGIHERKSKKAKREKVAPNAQEIVQKDDEVAENDKRDVQESFVQKSSRILVELNRECQAFSHRGKVVADARRLLEGFGLKSKDLKDGLEELANIAREEGFPKFVFSLDYVPVRARIKSECGDVEGLFIHLVPPEDVASKFSNSLDTIEYF